MQRRRACRTTFLRFVVPAGMVLWASAAPTVADEALAQSTALPSSADEDTYPGKDTKAISVLLVDLQIDQMPTERLRRLGFEVELVDWKSFDPAQLMSNQVIVLPTNWAYDAHRYATIDSRHERYRAFVNRGGGLVVCQPNPNGQCSPKLLPYPITFKQWYDDKKPDRVNLARDHFITNELPDSDMPFPADPLIDVDDHYTILARQKEPEFPSLAVCTYGDGRVVVQSANENEMPQAPTYPISDEILRRMIQWAAGHGAP